MKGSYSPRLAARAEKGERSSRLQMDGERYTVEPRNQGTTTSLPSLPSPSPASPASPASPISPVSHSSVWATETSRSQSQPHSPSRSLNYTYNGELNNKPSRLDPTDKIYSEVHRASIDSSKAPPVPEKDGSLRTKRIVAVSLALFLVIGVIVTIIVCIVVLKGREPGSLVTQPTNETLVTTESPDNRNYTSSTTSQTTTETLTTTESPILKDFMFGEVILLERWKDEMLNTSSSEYKRIQDLFEIEIDSFIRNSSHGADYYKTELINLRKGSVVATFKMLFNMQQTTLSPDNATTVPPKTNINSTLLEAILMVAMNLTGNMNVSTLRLFQCEAGFTKCPVGGPCIRDLQVCDGIRNCPDGMDEAGCDCLEADQRRCPGNSQECVMREWFCDGTWDCQNGADENICLHCTPEEFTCSDYNCIPASNRCDGTPQCSDASDEQQCFRRLSYDTMVSMYKYNEWIPICSTGWVSAFGEDVCKSIGEGALNATSTMEYASSKYLVYDATALGTNWMEKMEVSYECQGTSVLGIRCHQPACGRPTINSFIRPFMIGGQDAPAGKWPWLASITYGTEHFCGGTLINEDFVVTAAHCFNGIDPSTLHQYRVILGGDNWNTLGVGAEKFPISRVISYSDSYVAFGGHDIALIQLHRPVAYSDVIQPICLPGHGETFPSSSNCYAAGWGHTQSQGGEPVDQLQDAKMKLWPLSKCNSTRAWNGDVADGLLCAGYESGSISACEADSGGPLMCQVNGNRWKLVGIASYVALGCSVPNRPPVFSSVENDLEWIKENTRCLFRCDNGKCLYTLSSLCDRVNDCGDNSDEERNCPFSESCDFEDKFLCGYSIRGNWQVRTGSYLPYPAFDHTYGNSTGSFISSNGDGELSTPLFTKISAHCLRFFYHTTVTFRNADELIVYNFLRQQTGAFEPERKWTLPADATKDSWLMVKVDLPAGQQRISFRARGVSSIDDVRVTPGRCDERICEANELTCKYPVERQNCIRTDHRCNLISQCQYYDDESSSSCDVNGPPSYKCTFGEDIETCTVDRAHDRGGWHLMTGEGTVHVRADHTYNTRTDEFFYFFPDLDWTTHSQFHLSLFAKTFAHCVTFYYQLNTRASYMKVEYRNDSGTNEELWRMSGRRDFHWNPVHLYIPVDPLGVITITITAINQLSDSIPRGVFFAVDDLTINRGSCPEFVCPNDTVQACPGEMLCLHASQLCDGYDDCTGGVDEQNCSLAILQPTTSDIIPTLATTTPSTTGCEPGERACDNDACIPSVYFCNGITDCLDHSDENSVNCPQPTSPRECSGFRCRNGQCIYGWQRCDTIIHCSDLSDELNCLCRAPNRQCDNGICVPVTFWCDGYDDCRDNSDENNCLCVPGEWACQDGRCIQERWKCDGHPDCQSGEDELNCSRCTGDESFTCLEDYSCISMTDVCDGYRHCPEGSDEANCVALSDTYLSVVVTIRGTTHPLCSDVWGPDAAHAVCSQLGMGKAQAMSLVTLPSTPGYIRLRENYNTQELLQAQADVIPRANCSSGRAVHVKCKSKVCGTRDHSLFPVVPFIIGGELAVRGEWPWMGALLRNSAIVCGAVLVSPKLALTAAHCVDPSVPGQYEIIFGTNNLQTQERFAQRIRVQNISRHHNYTQGNGTMISIADIAVLELVDIADVRTICLPRTVEMFGPAANCFIAGWGILRPYSTGAITLRHAKYLILNNTQCQEAYSEYSNLHDSVMCAGYQSGSIQACEGDSGGPLMCEDLNGHWTVVGVINGGAANCPHATPTEPVIRPTTLVKITSYQTWIMDKIMEASAPVSSPSP